MKDNAKHTCPFCGATMEKCDESPIYGQSMLHPPDCECWLSGNLIFHPRLMELFDKRVEGRGEEQATDAKLYRTALYLACETVAGSIKCTAWENWGTKDFMGYFMEQAKIIPRYDIDILNDYPPHEIDINISIDKGEE